MGRIDLEFLDNLDHILLHTGANEILIVLIQNGSGNQQFRGSQEQKVEEGQIFYLLPNQYVEIRFKGMGKIITIKVAEHLFTESVTSSQMQIILHHLQNKILSPVAQFGVTEFSELIALISILKYEIENSINTDSSTLSYLSIIFYKAYLTQIEMPQIKQYYQDLYKTFLQIVREDLSLRHNLTEFTHLLHCSEKQLRTACVLCTGKNPVQIIHVEIMNKATSWLRENKKSIKEIAYDLGFSDPSHFSHFVTKKLGISPKELIKKHE